MVQLPHSHPRLEDGQNARRLQRAGLKADRPKDSACAEAHLPVPKLVSYAIQKKHLLLQLLSRFSRVLLCATP